MGAPLRDETLDQSPFLAVVHSAPLLRQILRFQSGEIGNLGDEELLALPEGVLALRDCGVQFDDLDAELRRQQFVAQVFSLFAARDPEGSARVLCTGRDEPEPDGMEWREEIWGKGSDRWNLMRG